MKIFFLTVSLCLLSSVCCHQVVASDAGMDPLAAAYLKAATEIQNVRERGAAREAADSAALRLQLRDLGLKIARLEARLALAAGEKLPSPGVPVEMPDPGPEDGGQTPEPAPQPEVVPVPSVPPLAQLVSADGAVWEVRGTERRIHRDGVPAGYSGSVALLVLGPDGRVYQMHDDGVRWWVWDETLTPPDWVRASDPRQGSGQP